VCLTNEIQVPESPLPSPRCGQLVPRAHRLTISEGSACAQRIRPARSGHDTEEIVTTGAAVSVAHLGASGVRADETSAHPHRVIRCQSIC
jgi:hypothetical protein